MPTAKRAFLRIIFHVKKLAGELLGATDIDERFLALHVSQDVFAESPYLRLFIAGNRVPGGRKMRRFLRDRAPLVDPELPTPIHDLAVLVSEEREGPERIARPPVRLVAVKDDRGIPVDTIARAEFAELLGVDIVADDLVL